jgi:hypothetical protein
MSELYRPSDRRLSAKLVPTFADRRCRGVSVTDPHGRILGFLDRPIEVKWTCNWIPEPISFPCYHSCKRYSILNFGHHEIVWIWHVNMAGNVENKDGTTQTTRLWCQSSSFFWACEGTSDIDNSSHGAGIEYSGGFFFYNLYSILRRSQ